MIYLKDLVIKAKKDIEKSKNLNELELIRIKYLGKKSYLAKQMLIINNLKPNLLPTTGVIIKHIKKEIQLLLNKKKIILKKIALELQISSEILDISLPGRKIKIGSLHPITHTIMRIEDFFCKLGFLVVTGFEIEDAYHNFDALNIFTHHPARTEHDTFWFDSTKLLRTQTSSMQIRIMKTQSPPIRIISSGRVYRNDYDQTHTPMFHQVEGLIIDKDISFSNLKGTLNNFLYSFFEEDLHIRFRPSYFPFTEPSAEVDIMRENGFWIEVLGCGMVHPNILDNVGISTDIYSGFAFGIGIERLTMLYNSVKDLRTFFENDLRFLKQFKY